MKQSTGRGSAWGRGAAVAAGVLGVLGTWVWAEQVTVQRNRVDVLKGKGSMYLPPVATAKRGESLQVLGHEGRWLKVQYGAVQGYVLEASLSGQDVGGAGAGGGSAAGGSTDATAATAAKGWDHTTWAQGHGYSVDGLNKMKATRDALRADPGVWEKFKADGHVGAD